MFLSWNQCYFDMASALQKKLYLTARKLPASSSYRCASIDFSLPESAWIWGHLIYSIYITEKIFGTVFSQISNAKGMIMHVYTPQAVQNHAYSRNYSCLLFITCQLMCKRNLNIPDCNLYKAMLERTAEGCFLPTTLTEETKHTFLSLIMLNRARQMFWLQIMFNHADIVLEAEFNFEWKERSYINYRECKLLLIISIQAWQVFLTADHVQLFVLQCGCTSSNYVGRKCNGTNRFNNGSTRCYLATCDLYSRRDIRRTFQSCDHFSICGTGKIGRYHDHSEDITHHIISSKVSHSCSLSIFSS